MSRNIFHPQVNMRKQVLPVSKGGTGANTAAVAAVNLDLLTFDMKDQVNGAIGLDSNGKIPASKFPSATGYNRLNVDGSMQLFLNQAVVFEITDYDSFKTYTVSFSAGSFTRSGSQISYTAPNSAQTVTMTINGRSFALTVSSPQPAQPTVTSPTNGANNQTFQLTLTSSAFVPLGDSSTHTSSDWQLATDAAFSTIVQQVSNDTSNKTSWNTGILNANTTYYVRVRYKGSNGNYSFWSPTSTFTTKVFFTVTSEEAKLVASDKAATNYFGIAVAIDDTGTRVAIGASSATVSGVTEAGAVYIFVRSGSTWTQEQKIVAADREANDGFGAQVDIDSTGTRVAISAPSNAPGGTANAGAVYIWTRSGSVWTQEQKIFASDKVAGDNFGCSVSLTGDASRVLVGAQLATASSITSCGKAYVFSRSGTVWSQEAILTASDKAATDYFGFSAAISSDGTRCVIGAHNDDVSFTDQGSAYVFTRSGVTWTQEQKLTASDGAATDLFGASCDIDNTGTRIVVGAFISDPGGVSGAGAAYIFTRSGVSWTQEQKLSASDKAMNDNFGWAVAFNSDASTVLVGAQSFDYDVSAQNSGALYLFSRNGTAWTQMKELTASDRTTNSNLGYAVALAADGSRAIGGAYSNSPGGTSQAGAAYIYV